MTPAMQTAHLPLAAAEAVAVLAGLFIGSFLNVVVYRAPLHLSVSTPRSFCPVCRRQLSAWENVPVVSWVVLRGRCHGCGTRISIRYPLVELATATAFALVTLAWRGSAPSVGYGALSATVLAVVLIDAGELRAPLAVAAIGTAIGDAALIGAFAWDRRLALLLGAQIGALAGSALLGILRHRDPACDRPIGIGRTALVPAGCWLGGLGAVAAGAGLVAGLVAVGLSLAAGRHADGADPGSGATRLLRRPIVIAVPVAQVVGLVVFAWRW